MVSLFQPDLTQHPPRSVRVRLGGYVHLPRLLDKARAVIAGKGGDYHYNCPLDQRFFTFTGIDPDAMLEAIKSGKSDSEMLDWVNERKDIRSFADLLDLDDYVSYGGKG